MPRVLLAYCRTPSSLIYASTMQADSGRLSDSDPRHHGPPEKPIEIPTAVSDGPPALTIVNQTWNANQIHGIGNTIINHTHNHSHNTTHVIQGTSQKESVCRRVTPYLAPPDQIFSERDTSKNTSRSDSNFTFYVLGLTLDSATHATRS